MGELVVIEVEESTKCSTESAIAARRPPPDPFLGNQARPGFSLPERAGFRERPCALGAGRRHDNGRDVLDGRGDLIVGLS